MAQLIDEIGAKVPAGLPELKRLGTALKQRKDGILAYFDHVGSSNGLAEALNGRLEHLRGITAGVRRDDLYTDHGQSGALVKRPGVGKALRALHPDYTLVITTLD